MYKKLKIRHFCLLLCSVILVFCALFASCERPEPEPDPTNRVDYDPYVVRPTWRCTLEKSMYVYLYFNDSIGEVSVSTQPEVLRSHNHHHTYMLFDKERFKISNDTLYQIYETNDTTYLFDDCGFTVDHISSRIILLKAFGYGYIVGEPNYVNEYLFVYE